MLETKSICGGSPSRRASLGRRLRFHWRWTIRVRVKPALCRALAMARGPAVSIPMSAKRYGPRRVRMSKA
jgi:hypothetical protein